MVEKIGTVRNPLTIIAIFAAIAEISGTAVFPFMSQNNQGIYIWFLMGFPLLLVVLFFLTLNFNRGALYATSDFKDEDNFFKFLRNASPEERAEKLRAEVREIVGDAATRQTPTQDASSRRMSILRDIRARYSLAEELVLNKISQELGQPVRRNVRFATPGRKFIFDGVVATEDKLIAIEVKYFRDPDAITARFKQVFLGILDAAERLTDSQRNRFSLILACTTDAPTSDHERVRQLLYRSVGVTPFPVDIRIFSLDELESEFKLAG